MTATTAVLFRRRPAASSPLPMAAVTTAVVAWGFGAILVKVMSIDGISLSFYRLWFGSLLMLAVVAATRTRITAAGLRSALPGGVVFGVNVVLFFSAVNHTTIANANLISALQPALVLVVAGPLFGEAIRLRTLAWTAVSILGVAVVIVGAAGTPEWSPAGDAMAVGAVTLLTAYFVFSKRARASVGTLEYMLCVQVIAALTVTPIAVLTGHTHVPQGIDWLWMTIIVFGTGVGSHILINWAHPYVDVSVSSLMMLAVPVVAGVAAWILLDQAMTPLQIVGTLITIAAMVVIVRTTARPRSDEVASPAPVESF